MAQSLTLFTTLKMLASLPNDEENFSYNPEVDNITNTGLFSFRRVCSIPNLA